ncbi:hypothetical protein Tco_0811240 [Tanacetum coccineum]
MATTAATTTKKVAFGSLVNHPTECVGLSLPPTRLLSLWLLLLGPGAVPTCKPLSNRNDGGGGGGISSCDPAIELLCKIGVYSLFFFVLLTQSFSQALIPIVSPKLNRSLQPAKAPKVKNNREARKYYLKHTMEQDAILREVVEQAKSQNPLDSASYSACMYVKLIQELLGYVRDTYPDIHKPSNTPKASNRPLLSSTLLLVLADQSLQVIPRMIGFYEHNEKNKVEVQSRKVKSSLNKRNFDSKNVCNEHVKHHVKGAKALCSVCNKCLFDANHAMCLIDHVNSNGPSCKDYRFLDTVKFGNDQIAKIMGYGDYQIGNVIISRVYYVEGLRRNLFPVGQFYDSDLEVAFRKHTCFVRNLEGVDLLSGSRGTNLYSLSIGDIMASSPICLI